MLTVENNSTVWSIECCIIGDCLMRVYRQNSPSIEYSHRCHGSEAEGVLLV